MFILYFALLFIAVVFLFVSIAHDSPIGALLTLVVGGAVAHFLLGYNLYQLAVDNPAVTYSVLAGYFPVGVLWALLKWYLLLTKVRDEFLEEKDKWMRDNLSNLSADKMEEEWRLRSSGKKTRKSEGDYFIPKLEKPTASKNKSKIVSWIAYWPVSFIWTMIADFVQGLARRIYQKISKVFIKMSDKVFEGVE